MAAPNLVNVSSIYGKTVGADLTTSDADWVTCAAEKVLKINSIVVSNVDGTNAVDVTIKWYDASSSASWHLCKTVAVPADSTLVVLGKDAPIYLEEGDRIRGLASAASDAQVTVSYEELDDA